MVNISALPDEARFEISFGPGDLAQITVDLATNAPANIDELVAALNEGIRSSSLSGRVRFGHAAGVLELQTPAILTTNTITLEALVSGGLAALGFGDLSLTGVNNGPRDLAANIQTAFRSATLNGATVDISDFVTVGVQDARFVFLTTALSVDSSLKIKNAGLIGFAEGTQDSDPGRPIFVQNYYFFQAFGVQQMVIDLQRGDDTFRGDPGFTFLNQTDEWGVAAGTRQQGGGVLTSLIIHGGPGNDVLYGGAYDDRIFGGPGNDFIAGGPGNDYLDGGSGNDLIAGNTTTPFDRFELVKKGSVTGPNNTAEFAALLPTVTPGMVIDNLSFHEGDRADYYIIRTPEALKQFSGSVAALLMRDSVSVVFDQFVSQQRFDLFGGAFGSNMALFAARDIDPSSRLEAIPVEQFAGVPEYYILKISNVLSFTVAAENDVPVNGRLTGDATLQISVEGGSPVSITVPQAATLANMDINDLAQDLTNALAATSLKDLLRVEVIQTAIGPRLALTASYDFSFALSVSGRGAELGFRTGQNNLIRAPEMGVYQLRFSSDLGSTTLVGDTDAEAVLLVVGSDEDATLASFRPIAISLGDIDNSGLGSYVAGVSDDLQAGTSILIIMPGVSDASELSIASDSGRRFIRLPAPFLAPDGQGRQAFILQSGDFNGDGITDLAVLVKGPDSAVYIIAGVDSKAEGYVAPAQVTDLAASASVTIRGSGTNLGAETMLNPAGTGDGLVLWEGNQLFLFDRARLNELGFAATPTEIDFDGGETLRTEAIHSATNLWSVVDASARLGRSDGMALYFGQPGAWNYDAGQRVAGSAILAGLTVGANGGILSFDSFLITEGVPNDFDQATVWVRTVTNVGGVVSYGAWVEVATNATNRGLVRLDDPTTGGAQRVAIALDPSYRGDIEVRFTFESVDADENAFEGWYIDNVRLEGYLTTGDASTLLTAPAGSTVVAAAGVGRAVAAQANGTLIISTESGSGADKIGRTYAAPLGVANPVFTEIGSFSGSRIVALGDLTGDGFASFGVNGATSSYLVRHDGASWQVAAAGTGGLFIALGDVDGDGINDFAQVVAARGDTLINGAVWVYDAATDTHSVRSAATYHNVVQVHLSGNGMFDLAQPTLQFEPQSPGYRATPGVSTTQYLLASFLFDVGTAGEDGHAEGATLVLAEILGDRIHFFDAGSLVNPPEPVNLDFLRPLPRPFVYPLAFPDFSGTDSTAYTGIDVGDSVTGVDLSDAIAFEGDLADMNLSRAQQIGDFDGDGNADILMSGPEYAFFFNGPVDTIGLQQAAIFADYQFDLQSLGRPADRMGDLTGNGLTDLVFYRFDEDSKSTIITIIFGGQVHARLITADSLNPEFSRRIVLTEDELRAFDAEGEALDIQVMAARWSGHFNAQSGYFFDDLVVVSPLPNPSNSYGYVFAGDIIRDRGAALPMDSAHALVRLDLFTMTVNSGLLDAVIPERPTYLNDTLLSTDPLLYGAVGTAGDASLTGSTTTFTRTHSAGGNGLSGFYRFWSGASSFTRIDPVVNFNWGTGGPIGGMVDRFLVTWTGFIVPEVSGSYVFRVVADDGVRLTVNGVRLVDAWRDQGPTGYNGTITLQAGVAYSISMEY